MSRLPALAVLACLGASIVDQASPTLEAVPAAMTRAAVEEAIAFGATHEPEPYLLRHAGRDDNPVVVAAVYTPFLRVAFLSHAASQRGERLDPAAISPALTEPHAYLAFRWYCCDPPDALDLAGVKPQVLMLPAPALSVAQPTGRMGLLKMLESGVRPAWLTDGGGVLRSFGAAAPFDDITLVAAYPLDTLRALRTFVVYKWLVVREDMDVTQLPASAGTFRYGVVRGDVSRWR
jgi:hypothetical protein